MSNYALYTIYPSLEKWWYRCEKPAVSCDQLISVQPSNSHPMQQWMRKTLIHLCLHGSENHPSNTKTADRATSTQRCPESASANPNPLTTYKPPKLRKAS